MYIFVFKNKTVKVVYCLILDYSFLCLSVIILELQSFGGCQQTHHIRVINGQLILPTPEMITPIRIIFGET